jgi:hypothetical protein
MHSAHLRLYLEGISPYRVVYTMIVSSLIALLLPLFSGALYLIKKYIMTKGLGKSGELYPFHDIFLPSSNLERLELKVPNIKRSSISQDKYGGGWGMRGSTRPAVKNLCYP